MMTQLEIDGPTGSKVFIERIDIVFLATGVLDGDPECIREYTISEALTGVEKKYGSYRPIQIVKPNADALVDYSVFLDLHRFPDDVEGQFGVLGFFFFCSAAEIGIDAIKQNAHRLIDWDQFSSYTFDQL